ncbi:MAG TPA: caspase family protein [Nitrospira sp.]|nr:caspase family protein [Nitrospira sp.]
MSRSLASSIHTVGPAVRRVAIVLLCLVGAGCTSRLEFPQDMGEPLPNHVKLEIPTAIKELSADYVDNCGHMQKRPLGSQLEDALVEGAYRTFKSVSYEGGGTKGATPEAVLRVDLVNWSFTLITDNTVLYDRVPADVKLNAMARVLDLNGKLLRESEIKIARQERVRIEPMQKNCDYIIDPFLQDTAVEFATKVSLEARQAFGGKIAGASGTTAGAVPPAAVAAAPMAAVAVPGMSSSASSLRFKATVLDENGNLLFEGGEQIRVRVDLVNSGSQEVQSAAVTLTGTPSLLAQFPTTTLSAGRLQPGQSRSVEFVATLPQSVQAQKAELQVTVFDPATGAPPSQSLSLSIQPTGAKADDIDHVPAAASGFKSPHTYLVSIGIGSYREEQLSVRKYAASDAELLTNYFQSLGGLPASNVRLLQDWKALRPDIDEALLDWLPPHMNKDAVVIVYFAGLATVAPTGDVYLVPYDGNTSNASRSYALKDLEAALSRLKAKQTLFFFDGMVTRLGGDSRTKPGLPQWNPAGSSTVHVIATNGTGKVVEDESHRHGLFTYYLLRALRGESDLNRDGEVTLGEATAYLNQKVLWASKTKYGQEQRPAVLPPLKANDPLGELTLTKLAAIRAAEIPQPQ